jgi:amino acid permease
MREPHRFPRALSGVMIVVTVLFATAGIMGYAAYGSKIQTVVIVNLPQEDKFVQAVQFLCEFCPCSTFHIHSALLSAYWSLSTLSSDSS